MAEKHPIGIFDSGYGGLTILKEFVKRLPQYDYLYLGDNARTPYGSRSFETVHDYTLQCVKWLLQQKCPLIILACNTASAKALKTIQQKYLSSVDGGKRILGVIRPTAEVIGNMTESKAIGILATQGTVSSQSYPLEINKFSPDVKVYQEACPLWVPLVENNEHHSKGADYFIKKHIDNLLEKAPEIDSFLLACTHYPLLIDKIREYTPVDIKIIVQGDIVAGSLEDYLRRHQEIETQLTKNSKLEFYTTDSAIEFNEKAAIFFEKTVFSKSVDINS